jgi:hypothetical protein
MKDFQLSWNLLLEAPAERWDYKGVKVSVCLDRRWNCRWRGGLVAE